MKIGKAFTKSIFWRGIYFLSVLLLNVVVARHFKAEESGQIYYIINIFSIVVLLLSFSLEVPMSYYLSQKKLTETQLSIASLIWISMLMIPAYFIILHLSASNSVSLTKNEFFISAFAFLTGNLLISFFVALFYAKLDFVFPNIFLVVVNVILIVLVPNNEVVRQFVTNSSYIMLYFIGFFVQGSLLTIFFLIRYVKLSSNFFVPKAMIKPIFTFASIAVLTNFMSFLMYRIDYFFVNKYCLPDELGNYIQACKLAQLFFVVPAILAGVVFPLTASGRKEQINKNIMVLSRALIMIYGFACLLLILFGYWIFPLIFGETFSKMYMPFVMLTPAILSYSVIHLLAAYYSGKKVLTISFWGNVLTLTIIILGDIMFIPAYGIIAAAIVSSIGYLFLMIFMIYAHSLEYKSRFVDFLFFRRTDWHLLKKTIAQTMLADKNDRL